MTPAERIITIRRSLRVFYCGLFSLVPVIGLFPAACAFVSHWQLRHVTGFNPARKYARWGHALALLGIFVTIIFVATVILGQIDSYSTHSYSYDGGD